MYACFDEESGRYRYHGTGSAQYQNPESLERAEESIIHIPRGTLDFEKSSTEIYLRVLEGSVETSMGPRACTSGDSGRMFRGLREVGSAT